MFLFSLNQHGYFGIQHVETWCWEKGHMTLFSKPLLGDTHLLTLATGWCLKHRTPHFLFFMILVMKQSLSKVNESYSSWSTCHPYCFFSNCGDFPDLRIKKKQLIYLKIAASIVGSQDVTDRERRDVLGAALSRYRSRGCPKIWLLEVASHAHQVLHLLHKRG